MQNKSYLSYLWKSKGRHGLHSPFVFGFVDKGLTSAVDARFRRERKQWLKLLARDNEKFNVTDLGAGSQKLGSRRSVRQLSRISSSNGLYGDVLYRIAKYFRPETMLELGTSIGMGSVHLKSGNPSGMLVTVEGCPETLRRAYRSFDYWKLDKIVGINSSFGDFLKLPAGLQYDLVFIDGHHDGEATLHYLHQLGPCTHNETLFIFDDIRWSNDMWKAWNAIVDDPDFHVTIDLGRMGLAWKRAQQTKEHFVIRPFILKTAVV